MRSTNAGGGGGGMFGGGGGFGARTAAAQQTRTQAAGGPTVIVNTGPRIGFSPFGFSPFGGMMGYGYRPMFYNPMGMIFMVRVPYFLVIFSKRLLPKLPTLPLLILNLEFQQCSITQYPCGIRCWSPLSNAPYIGLRLTSIFTPHHQTAGLPCSMSMKHRFICTSVYSGLIRIKKPLQLVNRYYVLWLADDCCFCHRASD
eukprot:5374339-Pyramimonas_sp.AAC.3